MHIPYPAWLIIPIRETYNATNAANKEKKNPKNIQTEESRSVTKQRDVNINVDN